jgi:hypothetical protein
MIDQFGIRKEAPAGRVKVDDSGYYMARRLDSDSEETPRASDSSVNQSLPNVSALDKTADAGRAITGEQGPSKLTAKTGSVITDGIAETQGNASLQKKSSNLLRVNGSGDLDKSGTRQQNKSVNIAN